MKHNTENIQLLKQEFEIQKQEITFLKQENQKIKILEQAISEIPFLKQKIELLEKNQNHIQKDIFVVFFILENAFYKLICAKNPILDEKVIFFMEFEQEEEAKEFEKSVFTLLKLQKTHIKENLFLLEKKHFDFLENTKQIF